MKKYFILLVLIVSCLSLRAQEKEKNDLLIKINNVNPAKLKSLKISMSDYESGRVLTYYDSSLVLISKKAEYDSIKEKGYDVSILLQDTCSLNLLKRAFYGETLKIPESYHTYEQILALVDSLAKKNPDLIKRFPIGKTTQDKRTIFAVKISNNVKINQDKPGILLNGCHHANEVLGAEICTEAIYYLLSNYKKNAEVTKWVDTYEIFIVPVVNIDGHHLVAGSQNPVWRKNTRDLNGNGILDDSDGVDINRNYDFNWAHGGSSDIGSERYRGEYPFSESENVAMRNLLEMKKIILSLTYHSSGEVIFYPWEWRGRKAPEDSLIKNLAKGLAGSIKTYDGKSVYKAEYGAGTVGQTYPYFYGRYGTFDFVIETGRGSHLFPTEGRNKIVESNMEGVKYIFRKGLGPGLTGNVKDAKTGKPLSAVVWIPNIETEDIDRRTSDSEFGRYYRLLLPKLKYNIFFMKDGYEIKIVKNVEIGPEGWTVLNVELNPVKK
jgi:hypothetical protein